MTLIGGGGGLLICRGTLGVFLQSQPTGEKTSLGKSWNAVKPSERLQVK